MKVSKYLEITMQIKDGHNTVPKQLLTLHSSVNCCCDAWLRFDGPADNAAAVSWVAWPATSFAEDYNQINVFDTKT